MTFEEYWAGCEVKMNVLGMNTPLLRQALREIAEKAWNAATEAEQERLRELDVRFVAWQEAFGNVELDTSVAYVNQLKTKVEQLAQQLASVSAFACGPTDIIMADDTPPSVACKRLTPKEERFVIEVDLTGKTPDERLKIIDQWRVKLKSLV